MPAQEETQDFFDGIVPKHFDNKGPATITTLRDKNQLDDLNQLVQNSAHLKAAYSKLTNGKFVDEKFPANAESIAGFGESRGMPRDYQTRYVWLRPEQFIRNQTPVLYEFIEPTDI